MSAIRVSVWPTSQNAPPATAKHDGGDEGTGD